jgi:hypothetical protein
MAIKEVEAVVVEAVEVVVAAGVVVVNLIDTAEHSRMNLFPATPAMADNFVQ